MSDKTLKQLRKVEKEEKKKFKVTLKDNSIKEFKSLRVIGNNIENQDSINPQGYLCDSGMYSLAIENDGQVYRCVYKNTLIGNLIDDYKIKLPKKSFVCQAKECACSQFARKIEKR